MNKKLDLSGIEIVKNVKYELDRVDLSLITLLSIIYIWIIYRFPNILIVPIISSILIVLLTLFIIELSKKEEWKIK